MPRPDYRRCRACRRPVVEVGALSHTRLCIQCAHKRLDENNTQIHEKSGPFYEQRRYRLAVAEFGPRVALALKQAGVFDAELLDATPPTSQTGA